MQLTVSANSSLSDFGFAKNCRIPTLPHSNSDSNSELSLPGSPCTVDSSSPACHHLGQEATDNTQQGC